MGLTLFIDGAARGNPGPAAFAFVISRDGKTIVEEKGLLGSTTNNVAEYTALVRALERAAELGTDRLLVNSDSELLVKQMNGQYRVKNEDLKTLYDEAKRLTSRFDTVTIRHIRREQNGRADQLCNEALDGNGPKPGTRAKSKRIGGARPSAREEAASDEALTCLRAAAAAWANGAASPASADQVWSQIWSILEEHGIVKSKHQSPHTAP
jgi:ribonuclease HI